MANKLQVISWDLLEHTVCFIFGHTREYDDFQWCTRCYKSFWEELE